LLVDHGARRHFKRHVHTSASGLVRPLSMRAASGLELGVKPVVHQGVVMGAGHEVHRAAISAVSAVRAASGDEFLAAEAQAAVAAVAGLDRDLYFVDKHAARSCSERLTNKKAPRASRKGSTRRQACGRPDVETSTTTGRRQLTG